MGVLRNSNKKSKAMKKAIGIMRLRKKFRSPDDLNKLEEKEKIAFQELFDSMKAMGGLLPVVIETYHTSPEELRHLANRIHDSGYEFYRQDFLPVALISFGKPLSYILDNKSQILDHGYDECISIIEVAKYLL